LTAVQTTFGDGNPAGSEDITFGLETELLVFGADLPPSAQSGVVVGAVSSGVVDTTVVTEDVIGKQGGGSAPSQFITTELFQSDKETSRGFADFPIIFNFGQPVPLGGINDNIAPFDYGDTRIIGFYHLLSSSGFARTQLVVPYDGTHTDAGFVSVTINGATYTRAHPNTQVSTMSVVLDGVSTNAVFFTFQNVSVAASGFDETDGTELAITWVI